MNIEVIGRLRPPVASDRKLEMGGLGSNSGSGNLTVEGRQRLVNSLSGNSFTYALYALLIGMYVNHEFTIAVITVIFALCML